MDVQVPWSLVVVVVGACLSLVGALIVANLRSIKKCISKFGTRLTDCEKAVQKVNLNMANCKTDCERNFVNSEVFLRETGFVRRGLENVTTAVNRMEGKLGVTEQLPQICGEIASKMAKEMKKEN